MMKFGAKSNGRLGTAGQINMFMGPQMSSYLYFCMYIFRHARCSAMADRHITFTNGMLKLGLSLTKIIAGTKEPVLVYKKILLSSKKLIFKNHIELL